ncbi:MAG: helix-turn-helix domain-containing protein [Elusimicrobia bacterium]|nr:helix-turn-helix domain-containing protein [Elusimicrobiota bacterium]
MGKKKSLKKVWSVSEKLEAVQACQSGLSLTEVGELYGMSHTTVRTWARKYEEGGLAALENAPQGRARAAA